MKIFTFRKGQLIPKEILKAYDEVSNEIVDLEAEFLCDGKVVIYDNGEVVFCKAKKNTKSIIYLSKEYNGEAARIDQLLLCDSTRKAKEHFGAFKNTTKCKNISSFTAELSA